MSTFRARREATKALIDRAIGRAFETAWRYEKKAFRHVLWHVQGLSDLLRPACTGARIAVRGYDEIVSGLLALACHRRDWLRPVEAWTPLGATPRPLFSSLAHHLLADFPVPEVMTSAWFLGPTYQGRRQQGWFKHLGQG